MATVTFCKNEKLEKQTAGQSSLLDPYNTMVWVFLKFCDLGTIYFFFLVADKSSNIGDLSS